MLISIVPVDAQEMLKWTKSEKRKEGEIWEMLLDCSHKRQGEREGPIVEE